MGDVAKFDDLFKKSWDIFLSKFWVMALIGALFGFLPAFIFGVWKKQQVMLATHALPLAGMLMEMRAIYPWILGIALASIFMNLSIIYLLNYGKRNRDVSFSEALSAGWKFYGRGIVLGFLMFIFLVPLYLLMIIPGIIFQIYWTFAFYILIVEKSSAMGAIKRSYELVRDRWWNVLWVVLLLALIIGLFNLTFSMVFMPLGMIGVLLKAIFSTLTGIFSLVFLNNFYLALKKRKA